MHAQHNPGGRDGRGQQGGAAAGEATRTRGRIPGVRCATCRSENRDTFNFCSHCRAQPYGGPPVPRDLHAQPVEIDAEKLQARRASILAKLEGRPGQQRKSKIADYFDAFLLAYSDGHRGWETATDNDVFEWCCYLDSQGRGTTWVHDSSCPEAGSTGGEACAPKRVREAIRSRVDRQRLCIEVADGHEGNVGQGRGMEPNRKAGEPVF